MPPLIWSYLKLRTLILHITHLQRGQVGYIAQDSQTVPFFVVEAGCVYVRMHVMCANVWRGKNLEYSLFSFLFFFNEWMLFVLWGLMSSNVI